MGKPEGVPVASNGSNSKMFVGGAKLTPLRLHAALAVSTPQAVQVFDVGLDRVLVEMKSQIPVAETETRVILRRLKP